MSTALTAIITMYAYYCAPTSRARADRFVQVIDAKTPQAALAVENEDARIDSRYIKDERAKQDPSRSLFNQDTSHLLG